jgi:RNA polymerase sigma factor (sigma-70 family)
MAKSSLRSVLQHLRKFAAAQSFRELKDPELLERFVGARDEAAFTVLIERHGPMVLGVCRRALPNFHDAEDACQATFLVLARKAASVRKKTSLSSWLHGVARRVAANLKRDLARRKNRERTFEAPPSKGPAAEVTWREVQAILDEALQQLPQRYRAPLILCYLDCLTRDEAARQLGLSCTTLHGRLERARDLLRQCLVKRGLTLAAGMSAAALGESMALAALRPTFVVSLTRAAMLFSARQPLTDSMVATHVLALTREVLKSMFLTKLTLATAALLSTGLFMATVLGSFTTPSIAQDANRGPLFVDRLVKTDLVPAAARQVKTENRSGSLAMEAMDLVKGTIKGSRVDTDPERRLFCHRQEYWELVVKPATKITIDGKDAKLADLIMITPPAGADWMRMIDVEAALEVLDRPRPSKRKGVAIRITAKGMQVRCVIQAISAGKNTAAVKTIGRGFDGELIAEDTKEVSLAKDVRVTIDDRLAALGDLKPNMKASLQMSAVKELVLGIKAYGATVEGVLKAVDTTKKTLSVTIPSAQMTAQGVSVAKYAKVLIDGKESTLSDLAIGMRVTLQMSAEPDQSVIIAITKVR